MVSLATKTIICLSLTVAPVSWGLAQDNDGTDPQDTDQESPVRRLGDSESEEYQLDLNIPQAPESRSQAASLFDLPDPQQNARMQQLLSALALDPGNQNALAELDGLMKTAIQDAYDLMDARKFDEAERILRVVGNVDPGQEALPDAREKLQRHQSERYPYTVHEDEAPADAPRQTSSPASQTSPPRQSEPKPEPASAAVTLPDRVQNARLQKNLSSLAARPGNATAMNDLNALLGEVVDDANALMDRQRLGEAAELLEAVRLVNSRQPGLSEARDRLEQFKNVDGWLASAEEAMQRDQLLQPANSSAYAWYRRVLSVDPNNAQARQGMQQLQGIMLQYANDAAENLDFENAYAWLDKAAEADTDPDRVIAARNQIDEYRIRQAAEIEQKVLNAIEDGDFDLAEFTLIDLIALGDYEHRVAVLRERLARERVYGQYRPGQVIQDEFKNMDGFAPAIVVVSAGSFVMGSPEDEKDRSDNEGPQHRVTIARGFGLGLQEVTVAQFRTFIEASGYHTEAESRGSSRIWDDSMGRLTDRDGVNWRFDYEGNVAHGSLPVIHITWNDAQAYVRWLSMATGKVYRLPTEAEFEYALRANTNTLYWWGDKKPGDRIENLTGSSDKSRSGRNWSSFFRDYNDTFWGPAPGASMSSNDFGLYDMAGNVSEWVQDCWHANYVRAPSNGQAWENPGCEKRVVRGGNWAAAPKQARSAARLFANNDLRGPIVGFRIAREL